MFASFIPLLADPVDQLLEYVPKKSDDCSSCYIEVSDFRERLHTGSATEFAVICSCSATFGTASIRLVRPLLVTPSYSNKEQVLNANLPFSP